MTHRTHSRKMDDATCAYSSTHAHRARSQPSLAKLREGLACETSRSLPYISAVAVSPFSLAGSTKATQLSFTQVVIALRLRRNPRACKINLETYYVTYPLWQNTFCYGTTEPKRSQLWDSHQHRTQYGITVSHTQPLPTVGYTLWDNTSPQSSS